MTSGVEYDQSMQHPRKAVTRKVKPTAHGFHIFMSICTGGFWAVSVYIPLVLWRRIFKQKEVTHYE